MEKVRERFQEYPIYALSEVAMSLHRLVERTYTQPYYIKAEILKLNFYPHSGHCYPELVEKEDGKIKAEMRAVIWSSSYQRINERFKQITGESLKENISILCLASIEFNPKHGLALHIQDIEPSFTLGEMVKNRNAVIARLKKEGVFFKNKNRCLPLLPKRIAVISVETSKGYSDFISTLQNNRFGYCFETELFPSILQGDKAIAGVTNCLSNIESRKSDFDCVVIVRGGGGDVGLSCYDDYTMAQRVATFPLPVFTGIGHSTNLSVTDLVAHTHNITPTDVAFSLIDCFQKFEEKVLECQTQLIERVKFLLSEEKQKMVNVDTACTLAASKVLNIHRQKLGQIISFVNLRSKEGLMIQNNALQKIEETMKTFSKQQWERSAERLRTHTEKLLLLSVQQIAKQKDRLDNLEEKTALLHPDNILKRGFSITRCNGEVLLSLNDLKEGDELVTQLYKGEVKSVVR